MKEGARLKIDFFDEVKLPKVLFCPLNWSLIELFVDLLKGISTDKTVHIMKSQQVFH